MVVVAADALIPLIIWSLRSGNSNTMWSHVVLDITQVNLEITGVIFVALIRGKLNVVPLRFVLLY